MNYPRFMHRRFGRLFVEEFSRMEDGHPWFWCRCDCGRRVEALGRRLAIGRQKSCGCQRADPEVRRKARLKVSAETRREIAAKGTAAWVKNSAERKLGKTTTSTVRPDVTGQKE
jgi:hypothetical protein